eukprot:TRINITY_DN5456_c0_g1_i2.p1 TRINITY_DN5456_c0_g1~~TRINITY_DN5456_c0_g1_i2.p1  ORF type:complete len:170 (+),score=30.42 TRINITY_DN5456_c0_g1_i2:45-554(+)
MSKSFEDIGQDYSKSYLKLLKKNSTPFSKTIKEDIKGTRDNDIMLTCIQNMPTEDINKLYRDLFRMSACGYPKPLLIFMVNFSLMEHFKEILKRDDLDINTPEKYGSTALITTIERGNYEMFKILMEDERVDVNFVYCTVFSNGNSALHQACISKRTNMLKGKNIKRFI